jgi:uncharacterized protein
MMIKPVGAECNLDCTYCFYLHKSELLGHERNARMSDEVLEEHIRQYIEAQSSSEVVFSWQGGEPTLMGIEFFEKVVALQAKYKKPYQQIENDLQTNGVLLDPRWARFLSANRFVVGLSVDGPRELHDVHRFNKGGKPTFDKVMEAAALLRGHGVPFSVLCVVNRQNAERPVEVFRFLAGLGSPMVQFTPCVETTDFARSAPGLVAGTSGGPVVGTPEAGPGAPESVVTEWSVSPEAWGRFLCRVWDEWMARDYGRVFVNLFENVIATSVGMPSQMCTHAEFCGKAMALEHNGEVYSCDHFVYPEYNVGNILREHEGEMAYSERQRKFGFAKRDALPRYCRECQYLRNCWGECPKNRIVRTPEGEAGLNYLCAGWKMFYAHVERDMPEVLKRMSRAG